jgi:hypothetical protein
MNHHPSVERNGKKTNMQETALAAPSLVQLLSLHFVRPDVLSFLIPTVTDPATIR